MIIGLVLIVIGVVFFAQALGLLSGDVISVLWPLLVVVLGLSLISHKILGHECAGNGKKCWCGGVVKWGMPKKAQKRK